MLKYLFKKKRIENVPYIVFKKKKIDIIEIYRIF